MARHHPRPVPHVSPRARMSAGVRMSAIGHGLDRSTRRLPRAAATKVEDNNARRAREALGLYPSAPKRHTSVVGAWTLVDVDVLIADVLVAIAATRGGAFKIRRNTPE